MLVPREKGTAPVRRYGAGKEKVDTKMTVPGIATPEGRQAASQEEVMAPARGDFLGVCGAEKL